MNIGKFIVLVLYDEKYRNASSFHYLYNFFLYTLQNVTRLYVQWILNVCYI